MQFQIQHKLTDAIIFTLETGSFKLCVEAAIRAKADLSSADLSSANLSYADLRSADLRSADLSSADLSSADLSYANLRSADLSSANLRYANLSYADLSSADLSSANLSYADLRSADLSSANLRYANLSYADLSYANLRSADLSSADLRSAGGANKYLRTPLLMLLDQPGKIRAYKLVNKNFEGPYNGGIKYALHESATVDEPNIDENQHCGAGINLATLDWCMKEWRPGYQILVAEFEAKDIAAIPTATDGKFRVKTCVIVGEKDLKEIGLIK